MEERLFKGNTKPSNLESEPEKLPKQLYSTQEANLLLDQAEVEELCCW